MRLIGTPTPALPDVSLLVHSKVGGVGGTLLRENLYPTLCTSRGCVPVQMPRCSIEREAWRCALSMKSKMEA